MAEQCAVRKQCKHFTIYVCFQCQNIDYSPPINVWQLVAVGAIVYTPITASCRLKQCFQPHHSTQEPLPKSFSIDAQVGSVLAFLQLHFMILGRRKAAIGLCHGCFPSVDCNSGSCSKQHGWVHTSLFTHVRPSALVCALFVCNGSLLSSVLLPLIHCPFHRVHLGAVEQG